MENDIQVNIDKLLEQIPKCLANINKASTEYYLLKKALHVLQTLEDQRHERH